MISQPYIDGITDTVADAIASSLTAGQITAGEDTPSVAVACPDRWFPGDVGVVTGLPRTPANRWSCAGSCDRPLIRHTRGAPPC